MRDLRRMLELSGDEIDRRILAGELQRRGLLGHFGEISSQADFV